MSSNEKQASRGDGSIDVPMTPMIDVVFMLLIFFLLTFKIIVPEGDFSVRMPPAQTMPVVVDPLDSLKVVVHLSADGNGRLTRIGYGERMLWRGTSDRPAGARDGYDRLRAEIVDLVMKDGALNPAAADMAEVELVADDNLQFGFVIQAMTSITGYTSGDPANPTIHRLVEKVRLRPQEG